MQSPRFVRSPRLALFAISLLALTVIACGGSEPAAESAADAPAPEPEPAAAAPIMYDPEILTATPGRTEDDLYRDGGFKPLEVYAFFGIEPGMTVVDLATGGMYNAHLLAQIVGPEGRVIATSTYGEEPRRMERLAETFETRNVDGALDNVEIVGTLAEIPDGSVDAVVTVRNYHDFGGRDERIAGAQRLMRVLKPGGILGVVDAHTDNPDDRDESVHRMNEDLAREEIIEAGFEFVGASDLLYNPDDTFDFDGRRPGDPIHRYFIHRWTLKFRKPME